MIVSQITHLSRYAVLMTLTGLLCGIPSALAQTAQVEPRVASEGWNSERTVQFIGLPQVKQNTKGSLSLSPTELVFKSAAGSTSIERSKILSITAGSERKESGGTAGMISRAVIPFGGGSALAATITNKEVGLLTIEYRDERESLHGAVFLLPKAEAFEAQQQFGLMTLSGLVEQPTPTCRVPGQLDAVEVTPPSIQEVAVPMEYRSLLYEQLIASLLAEMTFSAVYRQGDTNLAVACPDYRLSLTFKDFTKGNAALRASTGPVGFFVGATSFRVHVLVQAQNGNRLIDKEIKVSQRGDSESLNITDRVAKSLNKELKKQLRAQRGLISN